MMLRKVFQISLGVIVIALGILLMVTFFGDFSIVVGTIVVIVGVAIIVAASSAFSGSKNGMQPDTTEIASEPDVPYVATDSTHTEAVKKKGGHWIWIGVVALIALLGVAQFSIIAANWLAPEQELSETELLNALSSANVIQMKGLLRSANEVTYVYVNGERIATVQEKGLWDMRWEYKNKGSVRYKMAYSDHLPVEGDFTGYEYAGTESGILGYGQKALEDHQAILYFYDAADQPVGYVNVETAYVSYRDQWTVYDMDDKPVYEVTAQYNPVDKQLVYTIIKHTDSAVNVLQVMGINFLTRSEIKDYYK